MIYGFYLADSIRAAGVDLYSFQDCYIKVFIAYGINRYFEAIYNINPYFYSQSTTNAILM